LRVNLVTEQLIISGYSMDYIGMNVTQSRNNMFPPTEPFASMSVA